MAGSGKRGVRWRRNLLKTLAALALLAALPATGYFGLGPEGRAEVHSRLREAAARAIEAPGTPEPLADLLRALSARIPGPAAAVVEVGVEPDA